MRSMRPTYAQRVAVAARFDLHCARCGSRATGMLGGEVHHRVPRRMGGTRNPLSSDPRNVILLCQRCHESVEANRAEATLGGWLLRDYSGLDDAMFPLDGTVLFIDTAGTLYRRDVGGDPAGLRDLADGTGGDS